MSEICELHTAVSTAIGHRTSPEGLRAAFDELRIELGGPTASRAWWSFFAAEDAAET